jgi:hypothetical protein
MQLKTTHKELNPIKHQVEIEFPWDEVEKRIPEIIAEYRQNTEIKGFRKGKAPDGAVRAQIGEKKILDRAAEKAAYDAFNEAIKDIEKKPIIPPIINLDDIEKDKPVKLIAKYYVEAPNPAKLAKDAQKTNMPEIISPEDVFPSGPPGIQSHGPYGVSLDALKSIPGVNLSDSFIPNVNMKIPDPAKIIPDPPKAKTEIPDPEDLMRPVHKTPTIPKIAESDTKENEKQEDNHREHQEGIETTN